MTARRNTTCPTCGKTHTRTGPLCRRCATTAANTLELTGGQWRYDPRSHVRRWVRDLVAQTFDEGHQNTVISDRISGRNSSPNRSVCALRPGPDPLTGISREQDDVNSTQEATPQVGVSTYRATCPRCGRTRKAKAGLKSLICRACRNIERQNAALEPGDALNGGHWVGGLVKRWVVAPIPWPAPPTLGFTCGCGCLLLNAEETCPSCMVAALGSSVLADQVAA